MIFTAIYTDIVQVLSQIKKCLEPIRVCRLVCDRVALHGMSHRAQYDSDYDLDSAGIFFHNYGLQYSFLQSEMCDICKDEGYRHEQFCLQTLFNKDFFCT